MDEQNPKLKLGVNSPSNTVDNQVHNEEDHQEEHQEEQQVHGKAVVAYGLMLLNLLFPVLMYFFLTLMWLKHRKSQDYLLYVAINQAWISATLSTLIFITDNLIIIYFAQYKSTFALIVFETYYIFVVPIFLIPGLLGLVKSNVNQLYYFPMLGRCFKKSCKANEIESMKESGGH